MYDPLPAWPTLYIYTGLIAFVLSAFLMPFGIRILRKMNIMDQVSVEKIHTAPVPRGGGIIIFIAFAIAVLIPDYRDNPMKGVLMGAFLCLVVGAIDDIRGGVPAVIKVGVLVVGTIIMSSFGVQLHLFNNYPLDLVFVLVGCVLRRL